MMLSAAAEALPPLIPPADLKRGIVYPHLAQIRKISQHVAAEVMTTAAEEGHLNSPQAVRALAQGEDALLEWIEANMYKPKYSSLIRLPPGFME
jgi:hypothetical protein